MLPFLMEFHAIKMDIIRCYLLPNTTALEFYRQKYQYATVQKQIQPFISIIKFYRIKTLLAKT